MQTLEIPPIHALAKEFLKEPQVSCPVAHGFAPGVYIREIFMPAGTVVIGHEHKTEHFNVLLKGRCRVIVGDEVSELSGPCTFVSKAGVQKIVNVLTDCMWQTIHANPDDCQDIETLEDRCVYKVAASLTTEQERELKA